MSPCRQVSVTSLREQATRPMAWMVAATNTLSELAMYVYNTSNTRETMTMHGRGKGGWEERGRWSWRHKLTRNSLRMEWMLVSPAMLAMMSN